MPTGNINIMRSASVTTQVQSSAIRLAGSQNLQQVQQIIKEKNNISAEELGQLGKSFSVEFQRTRGPQDRFIDMFI